MSARHKLQKCKDIWVRRPNTEAADVGLECRLPVTRKRSSKASSNIYARRCLVFDEERSLIDRESHGQTALMRNVVYSIKKIISALLSLLYKMYSHPWQFLAQNYVLQWWFFCEWVTTAMGLRGFLVFALHFTTTLQIVNSVQTVGEKLGLDDHLWAT